LEMEKVKYIDLFCGVGGFRHALKSPGSQCVFSSDIDPDARLIYAQNWGEEPAGDIGQVGVAEIPPHDVLCGGFPCQPFSITGYITARDFTDCTAPSTQCSFFGKCKEFPKSWRGRDIGEDY